MSVTLTGSPLSGLAAKMQAAAERALAAASVAAHQSIWEGELSGPHTGRYYRSRREGKKGRTPYPHAFGHVTESGDMHQASAPGEQPHADTRELLKALKIVIVVKGQHIKVGWVDDHPAMIARTLNNGNASGTLLPRWFMPEALRKANQAARLELSLTRF
jgi:hypothetical protein